MSNLKKLQDLTTAIASASHPMRQNNLLFEQPVVCLSPYGSYGKYVCHMNWGQHSMVPKALRDICLTDDRYDSPEEAVDALYERMVAAAKSMSDAIANENAVLLMHLREP